MRVLAKFEGVPSGDFSDQRRYAAKQSMFALVQGCGLEVLIVEGGEIPGSALRAKLCPSEGDLGVAYRSYGAAFWARCSRIATPTLGSTTVLRVSRAHALGW